MIKVNKKIVFPAMAFAIAVTAAFASSPRNSKVVALHVGYKKVGLQCIDTGVVCTDVINTVICRDASNNTLYKYISPTQCPDVLYRPMLR